MNNPLFRDLMVVLSILFLTLGILYALFLDHGSAQTFIGLGLGFAILSNLKP